LNTYQVAQVGEGQGAVWLSCTQPQEAQEILTELRKLRPDWRVRPRKEYTSDAGDETGWSIDKCAGKHRYALWWLIRQLCARGWEPYAVAHEPSRAPYASPLHVFRKRPQP
jgi:hypothetical protein